MTGRPAGLSLTGVPSAVTTDQVAAAFAALGLPPGGVTRVEIDSGGVWVDLAAPASIAGVRRIVEVRLHLPVLPVPHETEPPRPHRTLHPRRDDDYGASVGDTPPERSKLPT